MLWIAAAIGAAAVIGVVNIIDSHLVSRRMPSYRAFLLPLGVVHLVFIVVILGMYPLPAEISVTTLLAAFGSGIARTAGALIMIYVLRSEEVSRVIPVTSTFPIFVALFAIPILGENLGGLEWLGIIITVAGAVLISIQRGAGGKGARFSRSFLLLLVSSLLVGIGNTLSKFAMTDISFWNMYAIHSICLTSIILFISLRPKVIRDIREMKDRNRALVLLTINECIALVGVLLSFWAIQEGPVSLVSTITSVRPAFVFVYALVLSRMFPKVLEERLDRGVIIAKIVSIGLIVGGVTLLTLTS